MKLKTLIKKLRAAGFSVTVKLDPDDNLTLDATQPDVNKGYPNSVMLALTGGSWWGDQDELNLRIREYNERRHRHAA